MKFLVSIYNSIKKAITSNTYIEKYEEKHVSFFSFIKKRLDKDNFFGLPTSILLLIFIYILFLFIGIVDNVISSDVIVSVDTRIANLLYIFRSVGNTRFFLWVTLLGKWQIILYFIITTLGILWIWRKRSYIIPFFVSILGGELFTWLGKIIIHRPRPELAVYTENSFSFPSGHATIAITFYGFLIYLLIRNTKQQRKRMSVFFVGSIIILFIGFSRIYLDVHYLSDVIGGYLIGLLWLIIGISISEWLLLIKKDNIKFLSQTKPFEFTVRGIFHLIWRGLIKYIFIRLFDLKTSTTQIRERIYNKGFFKGWTKKHIISLFLVIASILFYINFGLNYNPQNTKQPFLKKDIVIQKIENLFSKDGLKYTETLTGKRQEPISFVIIAKNNKELINAFINSGWFLGDRVKISSTAKLINAAILKRQYLRAPMTPSFWDKKPHNFGFEKATKSNNVRQRHHARFWNTDYITKDGYIIYVGTASLDDGIKWFVTHKIDPNIDAERDILFKNLEKSEVIKNFKKIQLTKPHIGENFLGDKFFTDGKTYIIWLK